MKIQSICPTLQNMVYFQYESGGQQRPKLSSYKSQYAYHILLIDKGKLRILELVLDVLLYDFGIVTEKFDVKHGFYLFI